MSFVIPIKYYYDTKYKRSKVLDNNLLNFFNAIFLLLQIYLYLYTAISNKQYILLHNNKLPIQLLKYRTFLSNNCWYKKSKSLREFTNINLLKNKLLVLKWLTYYIYIYLYTHKHFNISSQHIIYIYKLYVKINKKYKDIINYPCLPYIFIIINKNRNEKMQNFINLHRTILNITITELSFYNKQYTKIVKLKGNINWVVYASNIITTSLLHGSLI